MVKALPGDDNARVTTADMEFSHPIFNRSLTRATLQHIGGNDSWFKNGRTDFVSSWRNLYLTKRQGLDCEVRDPGDCNQVVVLRTARSSERFTS